MEMDAASVAAFGGILATFLNIHSFSRSNGQKERGGLVRGISYLVSARHSDLLC